MVCVKGEGGVCGVCGGVEVWWEGVEFIKGMHGAAHQKDLLHKLSLHLVYIQFGAVQLGEEREGGRGWCITTVYGPRGLVTYCLQLLLKLLFHLSTLCQQGRDGA